MLYTVIPLEDVLEGIEDEPVPTMELSVGDVTLEVELLGNFQIRVVRIFSTDPLDYLSPHYQPGTVIHWNQV